MSSSSSKRKSSRRRSTRPTGTGSSGDSSPDSSNSSEDEGGGEGGDDWAKIESDMAALRFDDDEAAAETTETTGTTDPEMQAILDQLDAFGRGESWDAWPPRRETRPETSAPGSPRETKEIKETDETDEFATSKRELFAKPDFSAYTGFQAPSAVPASTVPLTLHPRFQASDDGTPIYLRSKDGGLGDAREDPLRFADSIWYTIGGPTSVRDARGVPMVACGWILDSTSDNEYLIGRDALVEETYQTTLRAIDANDKEYDAELMGFWTKLFEPLQKLTMVELPFQLFAVPRSAMNQRRLGGTRLITVQPGTYPKIELLNRRLDSTQYSPFSLVIEVNGEELVVVPDTIVNALLPSEETNTSEEKTDKPDASEASEASDDNPLQDVETPPQVAEALQQATEAQQTVPEPARARAARLSAEQIVAFFTGRAEFRRYVDLPPRPDWLRDEHVHYVTQDQLGALLVLDRMPANPEEIETARADDGFAMSKTTNGVQIDGHIYIREDRTGAGTEYHETVHKLSHPAIREIFGFWFNEGLTEHFTRLLMDSGELVRDKDQYGQQQMAITALMDHAGVTEAELAGAYFRGELQPLYDRVAHVAVHHPFSPGSPFSLDGYAARVDDKRSFAARQTLMTACGHTPPPDAPNTPDDGTTTTTADTGQDDDR
ncbi:hypothetical protein [Streptosporangium sp. V21-05]|uniref:hypothetical protein n=1 Tax=Streptosporangium sp. V21-05 TaxID=3446115 RepID=UPI003F538CBA